MSDDSKKLDLDIPDFVKRQLEVAYLMGKGAAIGAAIFFGIGIFIWLLVLLGSVLPPESKEAADPTPWSFVIPAEDTATHA
jgi:hypothetical protein